LRRLGRASGRHCEGGLDEDCPWHLGLRLSGVLHPIVCLSFGRGVWRKMTVRDAKNLLILDGYKVAKVRQGIYQVSKDWFTETVSGIELIEMAKELGWEK
jgi:hypothetical protein